MAQFFVNRLFGALVGHRHEIGRPLAADLQVLDFVKVTPQPGRCLARGTFHNGEQA